MASRSALAAFAIQHGVTGLAVPGPPRTTPLRDLARLDQGFEENLGQASAEVRFLRRCRPQSAIFAAAIPSRGRAASGVTVQFNWVDAPSAYFHFLRDATACGGPFDIIAGSAVSGAVGLQLPMPAEPLLYFRVSGANCKGEGPR